MSGNPDSVWGRYFDDATKMKGDSEAANKYFSVRNFRFFRREVLALLGGLNGGRILDVGCGTGHFSQALAGENFVVGIDLSLAMLTFARNKGLATVLASAGRLPVEDGRFDVVFANSVIQLIPEGREFFQGLMRAVRPGGRIIVSTINAGNAALAVLRRLERKKYAHFRIYPPRELKALAEEAGGNVRTVLFLYYPFGRTRRLSGQEAAGSLTDRIATSVVIEIVRPDD